MKTFDYETAWQNLARPMYDALPQNARDLYTRVIQECGHLGQMKNLNMPWPEHGAMTADYLPEIPLRVLFDKTPSEILAVAARVIHFYGHWWPSQVAGRTNPDTVGGAWKFSNYADQSLAARIHETLDPRWPQSGHGISYRIFEGFIRVQCSTPDSWTWHEIGLGTLTTWEHIRALDSNRPPILSAGRTTRRESWQDFAERFEEYAQLLKVAVRPSGRVAEFLDTAAYMVDESEIKARHARAVRDDPTRLERARRKVVDGFAHTVAKATVRRDGYLWLIDHGIDTENAIYYDHTKRWCFGWLEPLSPEAKSALLDVVSEFPFDYDIKEGRA